MSDLKRMMLKETEKINKDTVRDTDIPTEYLIGFVFVVIAAAGGFIFY